MTTSRPYHHGDLRGAILEAAAAAVDRDGVAALSLRALAHEVGVSHTAPRHHFGDKRGIVTALAAQGYEALTAELGQASSCGTFLDVGVAYVGWAVTHPAHYQVMFRPELVDGSDPAHAEALNGLRRALVDSLRAGRPGTDRTDRTDPGDRTDHPGDAAADGDGIPVLGLAAWSIVHGFVTLALAGSLPLPADAGPEATLALARATLARLDTSTGPG